jgi:hypothetical protein
MIKVTSEVENYDDPRKASMKVESHWNDPRFVVLNIGGCIFTAVAADLKAAIDNATNTRRF